ncbi:hypothetical protein FACS1894184_20560 [Clostridia bacterium]|nr:hypothetical protein FACS1894184_20560 [Clostridia bacterium]
MNKINRFWNWARDADSDERVLYLEGVIAEQGWLDDDITPAVFKDELFSGSGPITIWLSMFSRRAVTNCLLDTSPRNSRDELVRRKRKRFLSEMEPASRPAF